MTSVQSWPLARAVAGLLACFVISCSNAKTSAGAIDPPAPTCTARPGVDWSWKVGPFSADEADPADASGTPWYALGFDDSAYAAVSLPDTGIPPAEDGLYRTVFDLTAVPEKFTVDVQSDDGLWLYVNAELIGHWGAASHEGGCVNIGSCAANTSVTPISIAPWLVSGTNVLAVRVTNGDGGSSFMITACL